MSYLPRPTSYVEIGLSIPERLVEAATLVLLELGALGTALELEGNRSSSNDPELESTATSADLVELIGYYNQGISITQAEIMAGIRTIMPGENDETISAIGVRIEDRPWRDWASESRDAFGPFWISPGLVIAPPWDLPADPHGDLIILNPGAAFGLGSHPTTSGCLSLMPQSTSEDPPGAALDVGTGTGILAMRAVQCGYQPVVAFDIDPAAVASARENLIHNKMEKDISLFLGESPTALSLQTYSLIFANIFLNPLLEMADEFAERLVDGGHLIVSGLRESDAAELVDTLRDKGFSFKAACHQEGWAALRLQRIRK